MSICRVLREQGCQVAARTYRAWKQAEPPCERDVTDAYLMNAIYDLCWQRDHRGTLKAAAVAGSAG